MSARARLSRGERARGSRTCGRGYHPAPMTAVLDWRWSYHKANVTAPPSGQGVDKCNHVKGEVGGVTELPERISDSPAIGVATVPLR